MYRKRHVGRQQNKADQHRAERARISPPTTISPEGWFTAAKIPSLQAPEAAQNKHLSRMATRNLGYAI